MRDIGIRYLSLSLCQIICLEVIPFYISVVYQITNVLSSLIVLYYRI